jgi:anthranilate 1,2-dioxygenase small subunit
MNDRITTLLHAYAQCIDDERYDAWPDFFTDDGLYRITTREAHRGKMPIGILECRNKGMMKDRIYSMLNANIYAPHHYRHLLSAPVVTAQDGGMAEVHSSFGLIRIMAGGTSELFLSGFYADRIDTSGEQYRLRERIVVLDSSRVDTLIVAPI